MQKHARELLHFMFMQFIIIKVQYGQIFKKMLDIWNPVTDALETTNTDSQDIMKYSRNEAEI